MLLNREKRIKYLGFDDMWFMIIGMIVLSLVLDLLFNNSFAKLPFGLALVSVGISLVFSVGNWLIMRSVMIYLRRIYPDFADDFKRIVLLFTSIIGTILLVNFIGDALMKSYFGESYHGINSSRMLIPVILVSMMILAIYEAMYYHKRLQKSIRQEEQAKNSVVQAELDALRNQAQPHFLFNSFNTLRDIIDHNSKAEAKDFVDKLSDVYRFILESGNSDLTTLENELKFARSYTHIQKERFGNNLQVSWNIEEEHQTKLVVPMSLQLLLENAIKHNVVSNSQPLRVVIETKENKLVVSNAIQAKSSKLPSTKLGLKNIEKRYRLIAQKDIQIENLEGHFVVSIPLLNSIDQKESYADTNH